MDGNLDLAINGTGKEILWLTDNGYEFQKYHDPRFYIASKIFFTEIVIKSYQTEEEIMEGTKKLETICKFLIKLYQIFKIKHLVFPVAFLPSFFPFLLNYI